MLPLNTNIRLAYANGKDDEQNFIQNLSLFLCTFLKEHGQLIEKRPNLRETLMEVGGRAGSLSVKPGKGVWSHKELDLLFIMWKGELKWLLGSGWVNKPTTLSWWPFSHFWLQGCEKGDSLSGDCFFCLSSVCHCKTFYPDTTYREKHLGPITVGRATFPVAVGPLVWVSLR